MTRESFASVVKDSAVEFQTNSPKPVIRRKRNPARSRLAEPSGTICNISDVTCDGMILGLFDLGFLREIRKEGTLFVLEFIIGDTIYDAISYLPKFQINYENLQVGYSYNVTQSKLFVYKNRRTYSNSTSDFTLEIGLIESVLKENIVENGKWIYESINDVTLEEIKSLVEKNQGFTKTIKRATITHHTIDRYNGCEICAKSIAVDGGTDRIYYCSSFVCIKLAGNQIERKVCSKMNFKLTLTDSTGASQRVICCHNEFVKFLAKNCIQYSSDPKSEMMAQQFVEKLVGGEISCRIQMKQQGQPNVSICQLVALKPFSCKCKLDEYDNATSEDSNSNQTDSRHNESMDVENSISQSSQAPQASHSGFGLNRMVLRDCTNRQNVSPENFPKRPDISSYEFKRNKYNSYGCALIINMQFKGRSNERKGSANDVTALTEMFKKFKIEFRPVIDCDKRSLGKGIADFQQSLIRKEASCCFVVIMSHGSLYQFETADNLEANIYDDVMVHFSTKNFPKFAEKPKVFIFHTCQRSSITPFRGFSNTDFITNCLVCKPCSPGQLAIRNVQTGSYFIQTLKSEFLKGARQFDLLELLNKVQEEMTGTARGINKDEINIPLYQPFCFKKFYFPIVEN